MKMLDNQSKAVKLLTKEGCIVICAGGGGIPCIMEDPTTGRVTGIEAVIDKDRAACMVGLDLKADGFLILTDVQGVALDFQSDSPKWIKAVSPGMLKTLADQFPAGSMVSGYNPRSIFFRRAFSRIWSFVCLSIKGPKVESAIEFVEKNNGKGWAAIGSLKEADKIMVGEAGTIVQDRDGVDFIEFHEHSSEPEVPRAA